MRLVAFMLVFLSGCATVPTVVYKGITDPAMIVEKVALPVRPDAVPIPDGKNYAFPLLKGASAQETGVLISPEKAERTLLFKVSYDELRVMYEQDRQIFKNNRVIYEERLQQANTEIARLTPSWWDLNKGTVGFITGIVVGAAVVMGLSIGIAHAQ